MPLAIGIDLGATHTRAGLVDQSGRILHRASAPTPHADVVDFLISLVGKVASIEERADTAGIGISAAGPVDIGEGTLINPPNLPFRNLSLSRPLNQAFGIPVHLANDCHAGIIGEAYYGAAQGVENVVYITLSTGIGGGVLGDGKLFLGRKGNAAEIGHFLVDTTYNMICGCGYPGHWEGYASGRYLPAFYRTWYTYHQKSSTKIPSSASAIFQLARKGDLQAVEFLDALGVINARGMSDVIVAYDPERIIFDGSVALNNSELLIPPIEAHADRFLSLPDIRLSPLAGDAPLLGASILAYGYNTEIGSLSRPGKTPSSP